MRWTMTRPLTLVLDTNVVLDWLVFRDAAFEGFQRSVSQRLVTIITHAPAIDELRRVLTYPQCKLAIEAQQDVMSQYRMLSSEAILPDGFSLENLLLPAGFPRCRDSDDQHFLALTYHTGADGLLTKDKQLLRLRKRAARFGVSILGPKPDVI